jgi:hypothetical protein
MFQSLLSQFPPAGVQQENHWGHRFKYCAQFQSTLGDIKGISTQGVVLFLAQIMFGALSDLGV